jgi:hypothetical protein
MTYAVRCKGAQSVPKPTAGSGFGVSAFHDWSFN